MKENFWIRLAGMPVWIEAEYPYMKELCRDYWIVPGEKEKEQFREWRERTAKAPFAPVGVGEAEIQREQKADRYFPLGYPEDYLESLALYRKMCRYFFEEGILLFHGSALELDGKAYLFTGPSGTGKSTHAALWRECFGNRVVMLNDDKPLLRFEENGRILVYGTPYGGKEGIQTNRSAEASGIVILKQEKENQIRRLTAREAYPVLLNQTHQEKESVSAMKTAMDLVYRLARLPVFELGCTISKEAVGLAYEALKEEK